jgi:acetolactate synthase I/II/III large subunit
MKLKGSQIVCESLIREGVDTVFGYPGGRVITLYDALIDYPLRHVLVRHEQAAAHAADGYARASGKVGVCIATSGPGATNLVTGIATAYMDSSPIVAITGQVSTDLLGRDAFQEVDITGITMPITKHSYLVTNVEDLPAVMKEAFYIARTGRPGPVLIDIASDVMGHQLEFEYPENEDLPGYRPTVQGHALQIERAAEMINQAERPVIMAGHGVILANAEDELLTLAERAHLPVVTTLLGISSIPETHRLSLGMLGMHGGKHANQAVQKADLLVVLGARFSDRVTGKLGQFAPNARIIHIDIDPAEIGKIVKPSLSVVGDLADILARLTPLVEPRLLTDWLTDLIRNRHRSQDTKALYSADGKLMPPMVIREIWRATGGKAIMVSDVGQNQMWEAQYYFHDRRRGLITSGGLGTMGYALPAAMGAQLAVPDATVWATVGDGGFQMNVQELATIVQEQLPIKIAILNNGYLGMVRQWQELFYERRYAHTPITGPDYLKLAAAWGIPAKRVLCAEDMSQAVSEAMNIRGPVLLEFVVEREDNVYPMVPAGASISEMIERPVIEESGR